MKPLLVFDIECYRDYFLVMFKNVESGRLFAYDLYDGKEFNTHGVVKILRSCCVVGFNSRNYDIPMLSLALAGASNAALKDASDEIIMRDMKSWDFEKAYDCKIPFALDHIDLIEVAPGKASLKIYGARMHSKKLQDLPIDPSASISPEDRETLKTYCENDLDTTIDLYRTLTPQLDLRERMSETVDLRSKSDAQIAEAVIRSRVERLSGKKVERGQFADSASFKYQVPAFINFKSELLRTILNMVQSENFTLEESGKVKMPDDLAKTKIKIGSSTYQMGIGGLHSTEESVCYETDGTFELIDFDVASYYPAIILNLNLKPENLGGAFTETYKKIVDERLDAKRKGSKVIADSLKIVINGSFGKFGSKYSCLYSPNLLIQTTITGQLAILMLIERLEAAGISIVSANTDGIVSKVPTGLRNCAESVVKAWGEETGFDTEDTHYAALYSRDVNNYIAVKTNGSAKLKGAYAMAGLMKNPVNEICTEAVVLYLTLGVPLDFTIRRCKDVRKFLTVRACTGGAVKGDVFLGKAVRWYYAAGETGTINYRKNGNIVAKSLGAKPLMTLGGEFPQDIDYEWYIREAESILEDIGAIPRKPVVKKERKKKEPKPPKQRKPKKEKVRCESPQSKSTSSSELKKTSEVPPLSLFLPPSAECQTE